MEESFYERATILQILTLNGKDSVSPLIYIAVFGFIILFLGLLLTFTPLVIMSICVLAVFALYGYFRKFPLI